MSDDQFIRPRYGHPPYDQSQLIRICGRPGAADRPPLPAGHPISWGMLTDGTALDGADYPFPVFRD